MGRVPSARRERRRAAFPRAGNAARRAGPGSSYISSNAMPKAEISGNKEVSTLLMKVMRTWT